MDLKARQRWSNAIREAPDDDDVRMRCARWYASLGGEENIARADFILAQVERAKLPPGDARYNELFALELRLLKKFAHRWTGVHHVLRRPYFRRGFMERVFLNVRELYYHRRQLFALEPVQHLRVTGFFRAKEELTQRIARCEELQHVRQLEFHHQGPLKDPREAVLPLLESPHLTNLRTLEAGACELSKEGMVRFEQLPLLEQLEVFTPPRDDPHSGSAHPFGTNFDYARMRSLREATLTGNDPSVIKRIANIPGWKQLRALRNYFEVREDVREQLLRNFPTTVEQLNNYIPYQEQETGLLSEFYQAVAKLRLRVLDMQGNNFVVAPIAEAFQTTQWQLDTLVVCSSDWLEVLLPQCKTLRRLFVGEVSSLSSLERAANELPPNMLASLRLFFFYQEPYPGEWSLAPQLFEAPAFRGLVSLRGDGPMSEALAKSLCALPHLTRLEWSIRECAPEVQNMLQTRFAEGWIQSFLPPAWTPEADYYRATGRTVFANNSARNTAPIQE